MREVFLRVADVRGFWGYFLPLDLTMSSSMLYELIEWGAAALFGGDLGQAYLGTQGDEWDAHKDMALASLGALLAMVITALINWRFQRDFSRELAESLRVKHAAPLGEEALARMTNGRDYAAIRAPPRRSARSRAPRGCRGSSGRAGAGSGAPGAARCGRRSGSRRARRTCGRARASA